MKIRMFVIAALTALVTASVALAGPPADKGNPADTAKPAAKCKASVSLILKGAFTSAATDGFTMEVVKANRHGRALKGDRTLKVNTGTKFRRNGSAATLASFAAGDRLNVQVRARKCADAAALELLAKRVVGHAAAGSESGS